jgi:hypothetical protein
MLLWRFLLVALLRRASTATRDSGFRFIFLHDNGFDRKI